jgi:hypothetical protein
VPVGKTKSTPVRAEKPLKEYAGKRDFARTPEPEVELLRHTAVGVFQQYPPSSSADRYRVDFIANLYSSL